MRPPLPSSVTMMSYISPSLGMVMALPEGLFTSKSQSEKTFSLSMMSPSSFVPIPCVLSSASAFFSMSFTSFARSDLRVSIVKLEAVRY